MGGTRLIVLSTSTHARRALVITATGLPAELRRHGAQGHEQHAEARLCSSGVPGFRGAGVRGPVPAYESPCAPFCSAKMASRIEAAPMPHAWCVKVERPQLWGGSRRAPEATASFTAAQAAFWGQWARPEPWGASGGQALSSDRVDGVLNQPACHLRVAWQQRLTEVGLGVAEGEVGPLGLAEQPVEHARRVAPVPPGWPERVSSSSRGHRQACTFEAPARRTSTCTAAGRARRTWRPPSPSRTSG